MSKFVCKCVDDIFHTYDYNNIQLKENLLKNHNNKENAWIAINKTVYSIRKDDIFLLDFFKNYYGKSITDIIFFKDNLFSNLKDKILFFEKLKERKIGFLSE